jgi:hypothetical protein
MAQRQPEPVTARQRTFFSWHWLDDMSAGEWRAFVRGWLAGVTLVLVVTVIVWAAS